VWSDSDRFGAHASLFLSDPELKAIRDLGTAGRSQAVTKGVFCVMKALEIVVYMNNSSTEEVVRSDALAREKEAMSKKMADLESELATLKKTVLEKDQLLDFFGEESRFGCPIL